MTTSSSVHLNPLFLALHKVAIDSNLYWQTLIEYNSQQKLANQLINPSVTQVCFYVAPSFRKLTGNIVYN